MIDSTIFIGSLIIALTEVVRILGGQDSEGHKRISGIITILVAVVLGALVAVFAGPLGVAAISVGQGILIALSAVGVHTVASSVSTGIKTTVTK